MRLQVGRVDHQPIRSATLGRKGGEDLVEDAKAAPADEAIVDRIVRTVLRWRDAPKDYGPHKTIYNRFIRWSRMGVFNRIFAALSAKGGKPDQLMIDATHLKAHRTAASLLKKGLFPDVSGAPKAA